MRAGIYWKYELKFVDCSVIANLCTIIITINGKKLFQFKFLGSYTILFTHLQQDEGVVLES